MPPLKVRSVMNPAEPAKYQQELVLREEMGNHTTLTKQPSVPRPRRRTHLKHDILQTSSLRCRPMDPRRLTRSWHAC